MTAMKRRAIATVVKKSDSSHGNRKMIPVHRNSVFVLLGAMALCAACGCGHRGRAAVEGTVTLDGRPLDQGGIVFSPLSGTAGPTAGAQILDGNFAITRSGGTFPGKFRVEITSARPTGRKVAGRTGSGLIDELAQCLPARYNRDSELRAEVTDSGPNHFEFALKSKQQGGVMRRRRESPDY
jgi:hypothetical protein